MKSKLLTCVILLFAVNLCRGQSIGDFRSLPTPTWGPYYIDFEPVYSWERFDGSEWIGTLQTPTSADGMITIRNGHEKILPDNVTIDQVFVESGATVFSSVTTIADGPGDDLIVNGVLKFNDGSIVGLGTILINGTMNWYGGILDANTLIGPTGYLELFYTWTEIRLGDLDGHTSLTIQGRMKAIGNLYFNNAEIVNYGQISSNNLLLWANDVEHDLFWNKPGGILTCDLDSYEVGGIYIGTTAVNEGTLNGTGDIAFLTVPNTGGIISPGMPGSIGTLKLAGPLGSSLENSTLNIEIKDGTHDVLLLQDISSIVGGTLNVTELEPDIPDGDYVIISQNSILHWGGDTNVHKYANTWQKMKEMLLALHKGGVTLVIGTDADQGALLREMEIYSEAGIPNSDILRMTTYVPASVHGKEKEYGNVKEGLVANLILLDANPLENISNIRRVHLVFKNGKAYDPKKIKQEYGWKTE